MIRPTKLRSFALRKTKEESKKAAKFLLTIMMACGRIEWNAYYAENKTKKNLIYSLQSNFRIPIGKHSVSIWNVSKTKKNANKGIKFKMEK